VDTDQLLIAFDSTQQALRAEMLFEYADVNIDICPTPKQITAGCSLCIQFDKKQIRDVREIIKSEDVVIKGIYAKYGEHFYLMNE
jgi:hypothetical protein